MGDAAPRRPWSRAGWRSCSGEKVIGNAGEVARLQAASCESCPRDSRSKIKRDPNAVSEFKQTHPKPRGCHKCEVDYIVPLSKGGRDDQSNMQWLSREQHKEKTKRDLGP